MWALIKLGHLKIYLISCVQQKIRSITLVNAIMQN